MAMTKTQICNLALSRIGQDQFIGSLDTEQSKPARLCRLFYDLLLDEVLGDFDWSFAQSVVKLSQVAGDPPIGWAYQYALPGDCLTPMIVTDASGARRWSLYGDLYDTTIQLAAPQIPFKTMRSESAGTLVLVTDLPDDAYLIYTARVNATNEWSASFTSTVAWRLAVELAMPMAIEPRLAQQAREAYSQNISVAVNKNARDEAQQPLPESPSISIR